MRQTDKKEKYRQTNQKYIKNEILKNVNKVNL